jgi:phosphatidate cytidylyltransferase
MKRILSAVVFLPVFYFLVRRSPIYFTLLIAAACLLALLELYRLASLRGIHCNRPAGCALALAVLLTFHESSWSLSAALVAGVTLIPILSLLGKRPLEECLASDSATVFGALYLSTLLGYLVGLRKLGDELGGDLIFFLFLVVWAGDAAAYYVGSATGRHFLSPRVSPKKTVEGAAGGSAGARLVFQPAESRGLLDPRNPPRRERNPRGPGGIDVEARGGDQRQRRSGSRPRGDTGPLRQPSLWRTDPLLLLSPLDGLRTRPR